jgi:hypothetical protein
MFDQACGGLREQYRAWRCRGFHPLGHPDVRTRRAVAQRPRTDFTGDHPARIESDPQLQCHTIAALHVGRQSVGLLLNLQCGQTGSKSVVLQCNWGAEQRHHAVAVVFHGPAVALHHRRRALDDIGHDFAQSLHVQVGRDAHRADHVGEQHSHLPVLRRVTRARRGGPALGTETCPVAQVRAA